MDEKHAPVKNRTILVAVVLIAVGILFIAGKYFDLGGLTRLWPLFMFIPVAALSSSLIQDPRKNAGAVIPAVVLTMLGIFFLWLNFTDWSRISAAWPVFIIAPGLGVLASWLITKERGQLTAAIIILAVGLAMFVRVAMSRWDIRIDRIVLLGIILIAAGIIMLLRKKKDGKKPD